MTLCLTHLVGVEAETGTCSKPGEAGLAGSPGRQGQLLGCGPSGDAHPFCTWVPSLDPGVKLTLRGSESHPPGCPTFSHGTESSGLQVLHLYKGWKEWQLPPRVL